MTRLFQIEYIYIKRECLKDGSVSELVPAGYRFTFFLIERDLQDLFREMFIYVSLYIL